jgi:hypothetical protein
MHVHNRLRLPCCLFAEKEYYDANNIHEKFLNSDWLTAVRCFWNTEQKMKYGAKKRNTVQLFLNFFNFLNFLFFKFLNFLNFLISKCDLHTWLHNFSMYIINKYGFSSNLKKHTLVSFSKTSNCTRPLIVFENSLVHVFFQIPLEKFRNCDQKTQACFILLPY